MTTKSKNTTVTINISGPTLNATSFDQLRSADVSNLLEILSALDHAFGGVTAHVKQSDTPTKITCPYCGKKARVRRVWHADVVANTGIKTMDPVSLYPMEDADTYVGESNFDQDHSFYCGECGEDIAKTEQELIELLEKEGCENA